VGGREGGEGTRKRERKKEKGAQFFTITTADKKL
jgi:hypothetical protein